MNFQFTHPLYLLLLLIAIPWVVWLTCYSDVSVAPWRKWTAMGIRLLVLLSLGLGIAGLQWLRPLEGMNVFYLLDRSDSIPTEQQEMAREYVNQNAQTKMSEDQGGVIVFGQEASIESTMNPAVDLEKIHAVVPTAATDIAGAIRLATAAFPENGQRRLVLLSDGNENAGNAVNALASAKRLGVTLDIVPLGAQRAGDVIIKEVDVPDKLTKGQTFSTKIIVESDRARNATLQLFQNDQLLGQQEVELDPGKNLFSFPQTLSESGFYSYEVQVNAPGDSVAQNNRGTAYTSVEGDPRLLLISSELEKDQDLVEALTSIEKLEVTTRPVSGFPQTVTEMQYYDTIFLSNVSAGSISREMMSLLESAVRDFGVGLVCIGGDQAFGAGSYGGTPIEKALPVNMELDSRKALPKGALTMIMHGMEFNRGDQVSRDIALGTLAAMSPRDELGILLWDGYERWLFELAPIAGNRNRMSRAIAGMNQGDMPAFGNVMQMAYSALQKSTANLKHMIIFSDGDPDPPSSQLVQKIAKSNITISTVMIGGHVQPDTMIRLAEEGGGRFYNVQSPSQLPQIFLKETAVILKTAIMEEPFQPKEVAFSEMLRGLGSYPQLGGYVATTPKGRAEIPLVSDKGDPLLAHWRYGLGRAAAFTSDAKPKWASQWIQWEQFQQFWRQVALWSLRRVDSSNFDTEVAVDNGQGHISVEAMDQEGNYLNFLNLQTTVVGPDGNQQTLQLEQTGTGHYEGDFSASNVGAYQLNLMNIENGQVQSSQSVGASVNYSPELNATEPNRHLLNRLVEVGDGQVLSTENPSSVEASPYRHDRLKTFQPQTLWPWLLKFAILLFPIDVGLRRIQVDRDQWAMARHYLKRVLLFWRKQSAPQTGDESLEALLARRDQVRSKQAQTVATAREQRASRLSGTRSGVLRYPSETPSAQSGATQGESGASSEEERGDRTKGDEEEESRPTSRLLDAKRRAQRWKK